MPHPYGSASGIVPLDLRVNARPITVEGIPLIVLTIEDISHAKRLAVLQRVFFHDVLNTVSCISGYVYMLRNRPESVEEVCDELVQLSGLLTEEIRAQQDLMTAEAGDLRVQMEPVSTRPLLESLRQKYLQNAVAAERTIALRNVWEGNVTTDRRLLMRVVGNMLKNALEATAPGCTVSLDCIDRGSAVTFAVHNVEAMPSGVLRLTRSFAPGDRLRRGHLAWLLGERYLGGGSFLSHP